MNKVVVFDLDGTLIDTVEDITDSLNYAFSQFNYPLKSVDEVRCVLGNGIPVTTSLLLKNGKNDPHYMDCINLFNENYSTHYNIKTKPYSGIIEQLKLLKQNGYNLIVCTNKNQSKAEELINTYFPDIFNDVVGEKCGLRHKPSPDMIDSIIAKYSLQKPNILYVGDTEVDNLTALNAEVKCLLVDYGFRTKETLIKKCGSTPITALDNLFLEISKIL